ncbi:MAG TPA: hypothetical protein VL001_04235 [Candidimonas sp.]|nr:hypothetical protein [Candidimonas sp.]
MTPVWQWSVRRARWAGVLAMTVCAGGVGGLVFAGVAVSTGLGEPPVVPVALLLLLGWVGCRILSNRASRAGPARGNLAVFPDGTWHVILPTGAYPVDLLHAWPCFGWVAIRCRAAAKTPFELVLYRSGMPLNAWCELRRQVAAHTTMLRAPRIKDSQ